MIPTRSLCGCGTHPPFAVCARCARRVHLGSLGGPDVRQALERPPMPAHARRGHPIKAGTRACQETRGAALRSPVRHVRVPAPRVDQLVPLPALIRQRPRLERLLDRRTLPRGQGLGGLLLPRPRGGLLGSSGGRVGPHRHPVPAPPGGFPAPHASRRGVGILSPCPPSDLCVTLWDVMAFAYFIAVWRSSILAETLGFAVSVSSPRHGKRRV